MGTPWFSEEDWDQLIFNNHSAAAVEQLDMDLDAAEWSSWDHLIIDHIDGSYSANNLSLPADLQTIDEYLIDAELQDDNNNIQKYPTIVDECPVIIEHPAVIAGDQMVPNCAVSTNSRYSANNLSLPADLQAIGEYLIDVELQDDNNNIQKDPAIVDECPIVCTGPVIIEDPALIAGDQLVPNCTVAVTNSGSESKSMEIDNPGSSSSHIVDHGALEEMQCKGLRLLHLLTACAEAMSQESHDLVEVLLCRLRGLVSPVGSTMERVAYYLFDALLHSTNVNHSGLAHLEPIEYKSTEDHFLGALKLLHVAYPYIRIPHFTANQCILEAVAAAGGANTGIHIIDFDIMEGMQWPPLMEALRNAGNHDVGHMRITAIKWADDEDEDECVLYSGHTGRRLSEYATSVGIAFTFEETDLKGLKEVEAQEEEIVIVNCIWQLPHMFNLRKKPQLLEFLVGARHLNPAAVTLATGPHGAESNTADFCESFGRYLAELCTIFDSLEAGLPQHGLARAMVERIFFGPAMSRRVILSTVCDIQGPVDTSESSIVDLPVKCGYSEGSISNDNVMFAKYSLVMLCNGASQSYEVELVGHHRLVLRWASTPLVWVSTWKSP